MTFEIVTGTRPEMIKTYPIIRLLNKNPSEEVTCDLAVWNSSKHWFDNHGV
jgi:UDP-N-acetylglucosamine 2-epimerase